MSNEEKKFNVINQRKIVKSIHIQSLEEKKQSFEVSENEIDYTSELDQEIFKKKYFNVSTVPCNIKAAGLYGMFALAYNNHKDIMLSPDDIMTHVAMNFSKYVNENSEELRKKFVDHEGQNELEIKTVGTGEDSYYEWDAFFNGVIEAIHENIKGEVVNDLKCDFSTSGLVEKIISVVTVMDAFKDYFSYNRIMSMCGIENVHFLGTKEDWKCLIGKVKNLEKYDYEGKWKSYSSGLLEILDQFLLTYKGKPNVEWWNKIMNFELGRGGSGWSGKELISGWILKFYYEHYDEKYIDYDEIKNSLFSVPVKTTNEGTKEIRHMNIIGGFTGTCYENGVFRPQLSISIFEKEDKKNNVKNLTIKTIFGTKLTKNVTSLDYKFEEIIKLKDIQFDEGKDMKKEKTKEKQNKKQKLDYFN